MAEGLLTMLITSFQSLLSTATNSAAGLPWRGTTTRSCCEAPTHSFNLLRITSRDSLNRISSVLFQTPRVTRGRERRPTKAAPRFGWYHGLMLLSKLLHCYAMYI